MVEFNIKGKEFDPDIITKELQIEPSDYWKKGDQIKNKSVYRSFSCWSYRTGYEESLDVNNQLTSIINKFKDSKNKLVEMRNCQSLDYVVSIVIRIENNEKPAVYLTSDSIDFANSIKAEFDFDLYIYS